MQVKNTFLEFVPEPPTNLRRWSTTPAGETANTQEEPDGGASALPQRVHGASCGASPEPLQSPSRDSNEDNTSGKGTGISCLNGRSAKIPLHHLQTGDFLDLEELAFHSPREPVVPAVPSSASDDVVGGCADHHSPSEPVVPAVPSAASGNVVGGCADHHSPREPVVPAVPSAASDNVVGSCAESPRDALAQLPQFVPGEPAIIVKNTFIERAPDPPSSLFRFATTPTNSQKRDIIDEDMPAPMPPPPQLQLEFFHTGDKFEDPIDEPVQKGMPCHIVGGAGLGVPPSTLATGPRTAPPTLPPTVPPAAPPAAPPACPPTSPWPPPPPEVPPAVEVPRDAELPAVPDGNAITSICQPNKLTCTECAGSGWSRVQWAVDARKLEGKDKHAVSPSFLIDLPKHGPAAFRLQLYPIPTNQGRGGEGFKKAKGRGRIELKCESALSQDVDEVIFRIGIGVGRKQQPTRGPVSVNFLEKTCGGLPKAEEQWDFGLAIDDSKTFLVYIELAPPVQAATVNPTDL